MKIYEVVTKFSGSSYVVIARNESEAIEITVKYLNQFQTGHLFKPDDFCASAIDADKFSEPTVDGNSVQGVTAQFEDVEVAE